MRCALDEGEHDAPDPPSSSSCWQVCALDEGAGDPPSSSLGRKRKRQKRECWQKLSMTHTESDVHAPGPALHPSNAKEANEEGKVKVKVNLTLNILRLLPIAEKPNPSAHHGTSKTRLQEVLRSGCTCKLTCLSHWTLRSMTVMCSAWHQLSAETQVQVLHQLFNPDSAVEETSLKTVERRSWLLDGVPHCFRGFCRFLGHSQKTIIKMIHGETLDLRKTSDVYPSRPRKAPQRDMVSHFFMELYLTAAESLPEQEVELDDGDGSTTETAWLLDIDIPDRVHALFNSNQAVPVKHLPPGQSSDLWWQFLSWHEARKKQGLPSDEEPPSWASFYRCWIERWYKRALVFRRTSQHAECDFCWKKRTQMATQKLSPAEKIKIASEWRQHLVLQYEDRCIYWLLRFASRAKLNVLCIIADSMGKVRWAYPKYAYHRIPHELEGHIRPTMVP